MRKSRSIILVGGTLAAGAAVSSYEQPTSAEKLPFEANAPISEAQRKELHTDFADLKKYWLEQGIGVEAMKFRTVENGKTFECTDGHETLPMKSTDPDVLMYCLPLGTIVMSQAYINGVNHFGNELGIPAKPIASTLLAHEVGHGVQATAKLSGDHPKSHDQIRDYELQADCLAGIAVAETSPETLGYARDIYMHGNPIPSLTHGSWRQRFTNFSNGVNTGIC